MEMQSMPKSAIWAKYEDERAAIMRERDKLAKASELLCMETTIILSKGQSYTPSWEEYDRLRKYANEVSSILSARDSNKEIPNK